MGIKSNSYAMNKDSAMRFLVLVFAVFFLVLSTSNLAQAQVLSDYKGSERYDYINIHSGNKILTKFYNYGLVGNTGGNSGVWPIGTGNEYIGDVTPLVGIEFVHQNGDTLHKVIFCKGPRGVAYPTNSDGTYQSWEGLPGFAAEPLPDEDGLVAMSNMSETWPAFWPDKMFSDPRDQLWERDPINPGWRNSWNGYFGRDVFSADQESYFIMDDNQDRQYNVYQVGGNETYYYNPVAHDPTRGGMGIRVAVRGFQWAHFLAEDCIFWHYEITNISDYDYDKVVFGMIVGTLSGGRNDSEDDLALFDPDNDITYSWDSDDQGSAGWIPVRPGDINVGYAGYAFLESPGNPYDGIDNDGDSQLATSNILTSTMLREMNETGLRYSAGDPIVVIDYELFNDTSFYDDPMRGRSVVDLPGEGYETDIRGRNVTVEPNVFYREIVGNGVDDNYNGLIDEIYALPNESGKKLDHEGLAYVDYINGVGLNDPMIDEARDDGIDNDEDWAFDTDDVGFDGVAGTGDFGEGDGIPTFGEPNFDKTDINESDQIGLTSFDYFLSGGMRVNDDEGLWRSITPGKVDLVSLDPEDGDFSYGSGYFPLPSGKTERFSVALLFGEDLVDISNNKQTVQQIYDNNYTFVKPPPKPTVKAVPGNGKVTLYWDDEAESAFDLSMPEGYQSDFEGYKIYRATDPGFLENFTITDGQGRRVFHKPIAQFDLDNGNAGYFPQSAYGVSFYLGTDSGLEHVWVDTTVENGQTYFYAVTAYDFGYSGIVDTSQIVFFPAETPKVITVNNEGGMNFDTNTLMVTPGVEAAGYKESEIGLAEHITGGATGAIYTEVIDNRLISNGTNYRMTFGLENESNASDTSFIWDDTADTLITTIVLGESDRNLDVLGLFDGYYREYFEDPYFETWRFFNTVESQVYSGQRTYMLIPRYPGQGIESLTGYSTAGTDPDSLMEYRFILINDELNRLQGLAYYSDYQIIFSDNLDYQSMAFDYRTYDLEARPTSFQIKNITTGKYTLFAFDERGIDPDGYPDNDENILFFEEIPNEEGGIDTTATWSLKFDSNGLVPGSGDTLKITMHKPFTSFDEFIYQTQASKIDRNSVDLNRIKVYPNPYLATSTQEPSSNYSSGRGERRINFIHLPAECTIRIYNIRGELVDTVEHNGTLYNGSTSWDLRSKDGLDVAYGVYIYHVDSKYGEHIGKFAIIK